MTWLPTYWEEVIQVQMLQLKEISPTSQIGRQGLVPYIGSQEGRLTNWTLYWNIGILLLWIIWKKKKNFRKKFLKQ